LLPRRSVTVSGSVRLWMRPMDHKQRCCQTIAESACGTTLQTTLYRPLPNAPSSNALFRVCVAAYPGPQHPLFSYLCAHNDLAAHTESPAQSIEDRADTLSALPHGPTGLPPTRMAPPTCGETRATGQCLSTERHSDFPMEVLTVAVMLPPIILRQPSRHSPRRPPTSARISVP